MFCSAVVCAFFPRGQLKIVFLAKLPGVARSITVLNCAGLHLLRKSYIFSMLTTPGFLISARLIIWTHRSPSPVCLAISAMGSLVLLSNLTVFLYRLILAISSYTFPCKINQEIFVDIVKHISYILGQMADKYKPDTNDEGHVFLQNWCFQCVHDELFRATDDPKTSCNVLYRAWCHSIDCPDYPIEWTFRDDGKPVCTAFEETE